IHPIGPPPPPSLPLAFLPAPPLPPHAHLLALASARGGQLVTFDGGIAHLRGAEGSLRILEA
ncbi:MAG: hypothetical protein ACR2KP_05000, partial [Egibacteraceae bacterium]